MNCVVDTSVIIAVLVDEPEKRKIIHYTKSVDLIAPASVHWEVGNALAAMRKKRRIAPDQIAAVLAAYASIPIRFIDVDLTLSLKIAAEHDLYAYDAYVLACARENGCRLITLDKGLLEAAKDARIGILEVGP
jgi:predicted nucleic acid-binding protein